MTDLPENLEFEYAPEILVDVHRELIEEIILNLFEFSPDEYNISDESLLSDFVDFFDHDEEYNEAITKLNALYDTEFSPNCPHPKK